MRPAAASEPVIDENIVDSINQDCFLIGVKKHPQRDPRKVFTTWELMAFHGKRMKTTWTEKPLDLPSSGWQRGQVVADFMPKTVKDDGAAAEVFEDASSADADEVVSGKTRVGSRASLRSSTRNTPAKQRRKPPQGHSAQEGQDGGKRCGE